MSYDLVGAAEAAEILGIGTANFSHLRADEEKKGDASTFPTPVVKLRCGPIWERTDIVEFSKVYGTRKPQRTVTTEAKPIKKLRRPIKK